MYHLRYPRHGTRWGRVRPEGVCTLLAAFVFLVVPGHGRSATLSGSFAVLPSGTSVDLTSEGTLDWGHWGLVTEWSYIHKYGVARQITNSFITDVNDMTYPYPDGPWLLIPRDGGTTGFSWTNGTPVVATNNTTNGASIFGDKLPGNNPTGFQIQCPADATPRTLKVYVGTSGGLATFSASLTGATSYTDNSLNGATGPLSGVYTLSFQADSPGQTLTVDFTSADTSGYITLQGATLAGTDVPPTVAITSPADGTGLAAPATFALTAAAADSDGAVTNLLLLGGPTPLGQSASDALSVTLTNQPAGAYSFLAVATDNLGLSVTSFPIRVYVTTNVGTLTGSVATPPVSIDLTAEGTRDWTHWGLTSPGSFNHKSGLAQLIPNAVLLNASAADLLNYTGNFTAFSWSDGIPTAQALSSSSGVFLYTTNDPPAGFQLTVPATNILRRLKVYVGLSAAQGRLDAWLSDFSALPYSDASRFSAYGNAWAVYTFTFESANPDASLIVTWTPVMTFDPLFGNLNWQAATLWEEPPPPVLRMVNPLPTPNQFALAFYAQTGANYTVQCVDDLGSTNWQALTNFSGANGDALFTDPGTGLSQRFYRVMAQ